MTDPQDALRKTIIARIATRDTSVPDPTPEQLAETKRLLEAVLAKHKGTADGRVVEKLLAGLGQTGGKAPAAPEGGTAMDAIGGGDVIVTARSDQEAVRIAHAQGVIAQEKALVRKATPWYMKPGEIDDQIVVRRPQGTTPSGEPVYTYRRLDGSPAVRAPAARPAGVVEKRAKETMALARDIAGVAASVAKATGADIKELGNMSMEGLGGGLQNASRMSQADGTGLPRDALKIEWDTPVAAEKSMGGIDIGFGAGKLRPPLDTDGSNFR